MKLLQGQKSEIFPVNFPHGQLSRKSKQTRQNKEKEQHPPPSAFPLFYHPDIALAKGLNLTTHAGRYESIVPASCMQLRDPSYLSKVVGADVLFQGMDSLNHSIIAFFSFIWLHVPTTLHRGSQPHLLIDLPLFMLRGGASRSVYRRGQLLELLNTEVLYDTQWK